MPSPRPVVVEVRPNTPSSPKAVRFSEQADIVMGFSRQLNDAEAWSLYHFEKHSRECRACFEFARGGALCSHGHGLAADVAMHVYHRDGQVYSRIRERDRDVRVEVPPNYPQLHAMLRRLSKKSSRRTERKLNITYDQSTRRQQPAWEQTYYLPETSQRYSTIIVGENDYEFEGAALRTQKRGSLYAKEDKYSQPRKGYRVEIVEPSDVQHRRRRREYYD